MRQARIAAAVLLAVALLLELYPDFGGHVMTTEDIQEP